MDDRETHRASTEARDNLARHPERELTHQDAMARFLGGFSYQTKRQEEREQVSEPEDRT
ncbi:MAG TPA: hypothetical protein VF054_18990 [Micromonosporaceae bacterium]